MWWGGVEAETEVGQEIADTKNRQNRQDTDADLIPGQDLEVQNDTEQKEMAIAQGIQNHIVQIEETIAEIVGIDQVQMIQIHPEVQIQMVMRQQSEVYP